MSPLCYLIVSFLSPKRHIRESTLAKVSLGTLPQLDVAACNKYATAVVAFKKFLRAECHRSILECYRAHNRTGGTLVPLQNGESMYFPRAVILAIYADAPACVDCTCTGSACPVCFTPRYRMAAPFSADTEMRTDRLMAQRQHTLKRYGAYF